MNKTYLYIGLGVMVIGVGAYFIMSKPKDSSDDEGQDAPEDKPKDKPKDDFTTQTGKNKGKPDIAKIAKAIFDAMDGMGVDVNKIYAAIQGLNSSQIEAVKDYFDRNYGEGQTLKEWIEDEWYVGYYHTTESKLLKAFNYA